VLNTFRLDIIEIADRASIAAAPRISATRRPTDAGHG
jgi:hypothetical protein